MAITSDANHAATAVRLSDRMMTMQMSLTRVVVLVVLAVIVLLTIAQFGPAVLSGH
jgi:hypothetical protein